MLENSSNTHDSVPAEDAAFLRGSKAKAATMDWIAALLEKLAMDLGQWDFSVRLWEGTHWSAGLKSNFTIVVKHPGALKTILGNVGELKLSEAYIFKDLEIEGDLGAALKFADALQAQKVNRIDRLRLAMAFWRDGKGGQRLGNERSQVSGRLHSIDRDRQALRFHYDLSNEFYSLWLDKRMVYSCGYFEDPADDIDSAQFRKLDYICRKLRLQRGERLLDVGCGWGGLIRHAAKYYGVQAVGITLSERQARLARERIEADGLDDRCVVEVRDYREHNPFALYDKIVSVGMFEHVGQKHLPEYFEAVFYMLRSGGVFLNHGIAAGSPAATGCSPFITRYVFPDGELVPIHMALSIAEKTGFESRDLESLREHYALTLDAWRRRLETRQEQAEKLVGETKFRVFRLYLSACAHAFRTRRLNIYQVLFCKPNRGSSELPLTRSDWYGNERSVSHRRNGFESFSSNRVPEWNN